MTAVKLCIATPVYGKPSVGTVHYGYHRQVLQFVKAAEITPMLFSENADLVRCRSTMVRWFLEETDCSHLLFWDEDVVLNDLKVVQRMVDFQVPFVALPYPRKQILWEKLAVQIPDETEMASSGRLTPIDLVNRSSEYWAGGIEGMPVNQLGLIPVHGMGMGFILCERAPLQAMTERFREQLTFRDLFNKRTVALFHLILRDELLYSEDASFLLRAQETGYQPLVYLFEPASHIGGHVYAGDRGALFQRPSVV